LTAPLLVLGWGNPSRGDDALGPLFVERLSATTGDAGVEWLTDYQLQIEHALDLVGRARVLFVDASLTCAPPFEVSPLRPARDASFTSHALSPAAVMQVYLDIHGREPPPCTLLAIRGHAFELGAPLAEAAHESLEQALRWGRGWLAEPGTSGRPGPA
jgi:hydrogenase maturation protease